MRTEKILKRIISFEGLSSSWRRCQLADGGGEVKPFFLIQLARSLF